MICQHNRIAVNLNKILLDLLHMAVLIEKEKSAFASFVLYRHHNESVTTPPTHNLQQHSPTISTDNSLHLRFK
jgi:hypothetical protein